MNVYMIPGHGAADPGAIAYGRQEADLTRTLVSKVCALTGWGHSDFNLNAYTDTDKVIKNMPKNVDLVIEVHFNAFTNQSAAGTEIWIPNGTSPGDYPFNVTAFLMRLSNYMDTTYRGIKQGAFRVIRKIASLGIPALLLEVCFMTNPQDMTKYNPDDVAVNIANFFGYDVDTPVSTQPWYHEYAAKCKELSLIEDERYQDYVTRAELCKVLCKLIDVMDKGGGSTATAQN